VDASVWDELTKVELTQTETWRLKLTAD